MIRILIGSQDERKSLIKAAESGHSELWLVPKTCKPGDAALIFISGIGFYARASIADESRLDKAAGKYSARIANIRLFACPVPKEFIEENHPSWGWPRAWRERFTTANDEVEERLNQLLDEYNGDFAGELREGEATAISVTRHERNPLARQKCIDHHGDSCAACGFSFGKVYGETAEGFIHVHHLKTVASRDGKYVIDPIKDLCPVCANCHAIIHRQTPPLSIPRLKRMLRTARQD